MVPRFSILTTNDMKQEPPQSGQSPRAVKARAPALLVMHGPEGPTPWAMRHIRTPKVLYRPWALERGPRGIFGASVQWAPMPRGPAALLSAGGYRSSPKKVQTGARGRTGAYPHDVRVTVRPFATVNGNPPAGIAESPVTAYGAGMGGGGTPRGRQ